MIIKAGHQVMTKPKNAPPMQDNMSGSPLSHNVKPASSEMTSIIVKKEIGTNIRGHTDSSSFFCVSSNLFAYEIKSFDTTIISYFPLIAIFYPVLELCILVSVWPRIKSKYIIRGQVIGCF